MTKVELIASVAAEAGMSKKDAEKAVNAALAAITEEPTRKRRQSSSKRSGSLKGL